MRVVLAVTVPLLAVAVLLGRRRRARAEQQLWDEAAVSHVERDLR